MVQLKIVGIDNYVYELKDKNDKSYKLNLEFFDINQSLKIGDSIHIHNELLNQKYAGYSTSYTFGNLENKYGKANIGMGDIDVIKVVIDDTEIYLKRLYG